MKRLLLSVVLMVLVTFIGMVGSIHAQFELPVNDRVSVGTKMYYLTATGFTGSEASTACTSGFHMASVSEIQDPGNLRYVTRSTPAYDSRDGMTAEEAQVWYRTPALGSSDYYQESSPPSDQMGWVRAVLDMHAGDLPNCDFWQSRSDQQNGTTLSLHTLWGDSYMDPAPPDTNDPTAEWLELQQVCSLAEPVWCVEDPE